MSQERRERQKERLGTSGLSPKWKRVAIFAALAVVVIGLAYYVDNRSQHKHDAFARCLSARGVKMYGAWWCPHCTDQKEMFGASFEYAPYTECGIKGQLQGEAQVCKDANVAHYPTWQFPPTGEREERVFTLQELSNRTGCPLP
ncbi:MAG: hypothetical protein WB566_02645 [Terriglobales bacterium]